MSANSDTVARSIVDQLEHEYRTSVEALRRALRSFLDGGPPPGPEVRRDGAFVYPELRLTWSPGQPLPRTSRAFARLSAPGRYASTVTRPDLFRSYLTEQLSLILQDFDVKIEVRRSDQEIPFPYVLDARPDQVRADYDAAELARYF